MVKSILARSSFLIVYIVSNLLFVWSANAIEKIPSKAVLTVENLSTDQGLSQGSVRCIIQDAKGFMWFGTQDGLNRYDGITMISYRNNPLDSTTLSDNFITCIVEDRKGNFWVGTQNGFNKFDNSARPVKRYFPQPSGINPKYSSNITSLVIDSDTTEGMILWVGTLSGLFRFNADKETFEAFRNVPGDSTSLSNNAVRCLFQDSRGTLWVGTDIGLNTMERKSRTFSPFLSREHDTLNIMNHFVNQVFEDSKKRLWIIAEFQTLYLEPTSTGKRLVKIPSFPRGEMYDIFTGALTTMAEDQNGNFWLGSPGWGLLMLRLVSPDSLYAVQYLPQNNTQGTLNSDFIFSLYVDRSNLLWIGTFGMGVDKANLSNKKFQLYSYSPGALNSLCTESIRGIYEDSENMLWMGGYNCLNRFDRAKGECTVVPKTQENVYAIQEDPLAPETMLWVGTEGGGLFHFNKRTGNGVNYIHLQGDSNSISSNWIFSLLAESDGTLWAGMNLGIVDRITLLPSGKLSVRRYELFQQDTGTARTWITKIFKDRYGMFWIGTQGRGLYTLDPDEPGGKIRMYASEPANPYGLGSDRIKTIHEDAQGTIWIGTEGAGLQMFNRSEGTFLRYTEDNGLPNNVVYGILEDAKGNLWLSTNKGISRFTPSTQSFKNYDINDGLQSNEFNSGSYYQCKHGEMFFGGVKGLNAFFPDSVRDNPHIPPIVLTSFKKFNEEVQTDEAIYNIKEIYLEYDENVISFEFAALEYTVPEKNQYSYYMEGFDRQWIFSGTRRFVTYTHLDPGTYTFRVRGSNSDGVWNFAGTSIKIIIAPPYYGTLWFRFLLAVVALSVGPIIYYRRVSRLKKEKALQENFSRKLIEQQEAERKRIAGDLHDSIGQSLLVGKNRALFGLESSKDNAEAIENFQKISSILGDALKEVRQISHNLHPPQLERIGLTETIKSTLSNLSESSKEISVNSTVENINGLLPKEMEINVFRIVQEALNNILKHSEATLIQCTMVRRGNAIEIYIRDNGKGFVTDESHKGLGLAGIAERARIIQGSFDIQSKPGEGTIINIRIPLE